MTRLKIKDNQERAKVEFESIPNLVKQISDQSLGKLAESQVFVFPQQLKDTDDLSKDQFILKTVNDAYRSSNVMGFLGLGQERLIIESRFSTGEHDYFFQYLLERVLDFPNVLDLHTNTDHQKKVFQLLIFLFPRYLTTAMRKGIFKTYVRNAYNDSNIKGSIDLARHIRMNTPFVGNISYNQREFSYDNPVMQLIRHTIEFIKKKPYGNPILQEAKEEVSAVVEVTRKYESAYRRQVMVENKKQPIRHAYFHEYRDLQRLCLMILQYEKHGFGTGLNDIHGILFDGAWLWEEYINTLIGEWFYHPLNKAGSGAQQLFTNDQGKIGLIYPDFIGRDRSNRKIADAKYKPFQNIGNKDYLQVLAYMFRFDSKEGYYLYPEIGEVNDEKFRLNKGFTYENSVQARDDISVQKIGLCIPQAAENYAHFVSQMLESERQFVEKFNFTKSEQLS